MCNIYTNEHYWVIGSNTSNISAPLVGQPCQCGSVLWSSRSTPHAPDAAKSAAEIEWSYKIAAQVMLAVGLLTYE